MMAFCHSITTPDKPATIGLCLPEHLDTGSEAALSQNRMSLCHRQLWPQRDQKDARRGEKTRREERKSGRDTGEMDRAVENVGAPLECGDALHQKISWMLKRVPVTWKKVNSSADLARSTVEKMSGAVETLCASAKNPCSTNEKDRSPAERVGAMHRKMHATRRKIVSSS
jgi:hypothetical protein